MHCFIRYFAIFYDLFSTQKNIGKGIVAIPYEIVSIPPPPNSQTLKHPNIPTPKHPHPDSDLE